MQVPALGSAAEPPALLAASLGWGDGTGELLARAAGRRARTSRGRVPRRSTRRTGACSPRPTSPPKAKRVIYLFMSGGPSQLDLFDYKPLLNQMNGKDLPDSVRMGQRLTGMSSNQATLPLAGSLFKFARHGKSGAWVSELLPHTARVVDDLCFIRSRLHRGDQPRPGDHLLPDRLADRGAAVDGGLAELRPGLGQPEPAHVLRPDQPAAGRPAALLAALGQRLPPLGPPGRPVPRRGRAGALPRQPAGSLLRRPAQDARPAPRAAPDGVRRDRSTRRSTPGSPSTRWPTGCRPRSRK